MTINEKLWKIQNVENNITLSFGSAARWFTIYSTTQLWLYDDKYKDKIKTQPMSMQTMSHMFANISKPHLRESEID